MSDPSRPEAKPARRILITFLVLFALVLSGLYGAMSYFDGIRSEQARKMLVEE